jgi:hypothetical protein
MNYAYYVDCYPPVKGLETMLIVIDISLNFALKRMIMLYFETSLLESLLEFSKRA